MRIIASFVDYESSNKSLDIFYILIDLCLILGIVGFYLVQRSNLFWLGHIGFAITLCGLGFIAGPEADISNISAYQIGSTIIGFGILMLSLDLIKSKLCGYIAPISFISSVLIGLISMAVSNHQLFILSGILFGTGFTALGIQTLRTN